MRSKTSGSTSISIACVPPLPLARSPFALARSRALRALSVSLCRGAPPSTRASHPHRPRGTHHNRSPIDVACTGDSRPLQACENAEVVRCRQDPVGAPCAARKKRHLPRDRTRLFEGRRSPPFVGRRRAQRGRRRLGRGCGGARGVEGEQGASSCSQLALYHKTFSIRKCFSVDVNMSTS